MTIFTIIILFTGTISPTLLIQDADAIKSKGTMNPEIHSKKVCGDQLCSTTHETPTSPKGQIIIPENGKQIDNPDASLLFVQLATSGTFQDKDGKKILTFVDVSPTTIYFADRPSRETGSLETDVFISTMWEEGDDNFADDPPNAALEIINEIGGPTVFIIELLSATYNPESHIVQYEINILEEATEGLSHYVLFNDIKFPGTFDDSVLFVDGFLDLAKKLGHVIGKADDLIDKGLDIAGGETKKQFTDLGHQINKGLDPVKKAGDYLKSKTIDPITDKVITKITPLTSKNAGVFCELGKEIGGKAGCAIGTQFSMEQIRIGLGAVMRSDIDTNMDVDMLSMFEAIRDAIKSDESNEAIAFAIMYNVFMKQDSIIEEDFRAFMNSFRDNPAMTKAYDADNFCGLSNAEYFKNVLEPFFTYNLVHELYFTIYDNLENGMSISKVPGHLDKTLNDTVKAVLLYSLINLRDSCDDQPGDLYSLIYHSIIHTYKNNLVASTNDDGETTFPQIIPSKAKIMADKAAEISANAEREASYLIARAGGETVKTVEAEAYISAVKLHAGQVADVAEKLGIFAVIHDKIAGEAGGYGIEASSFGNEGVELNDMIVYSNDVSVEYNAFDSRVNNFSHEIESSVSTELSNEFNLFLNDSELYMDDIVSSLESGSIYDPGDGASLETGDGALPEMGRTTGSLDMGEDTGSLDIGEDFDPNGYGDADVDLFSEASDFGMNTLEEFDTESTFSDFIRDVMGHDVENNDFTYEMVEDLLNRTIKDIVEAEVEELLEETAESSVPK